ncbi:lytic transglycosylase domain-containing protein [Acinetobacter baumannii]|uniref:lytic transglycosylase domain-containing protein n=1 Tax=Acinetobacter baumannii TaxID=470 RepID=UPI0034E203A5
MIATCAPNVAPVTVQEIMRVESSFNPLAVNVNTKKINGKTVRFRIPFKIRTVDDAVKVSRMAIAAGHSVDMGYMQVNSTNLKSLGYSIEDMFDPCKNIKAGSKILTAFYSSAIRSHSNEQAALRAALSAYNTGDFRRGFANGYVAKYLSRKQPYVHVPQYQPQTAQIQWASNPYSSASSIFNKPKQENNMAIKPANLIVQPVVSKSPADAGTPGVQVQYTADQAALNGAFQETALSEGDAWASNADIARNPQTAAIDPQSTAIVRNGQRVR